MQKVIRFGVIGCGLMGREFASAAARWCHLTNISARPEIVAVCDKNPAAAAWFRDNFPSVQQVTDDYRALLANPEVDAVYVAVPHNLHQQIYIDILNAGKHMLGEKPFGIDRDANEAILAAVAAHPELIVRCSSEFPYYPACRQLIKWIEEGRFGKIIEVRSAFRHSSDMDPTKPINWKRRIATNGEYGCLGDLGIHAQHVAFRAGWKPEKVYAQLINLITQRPGPDGSMVPCDTWDNAMVLSTVRDKDGHEFPWLMETKRMSPGSTNEWFVEVYGMECSAKFNTSDPGAFWYTQAWGKEQAWCRINVGFKTLFPTITGGIFEFGFTDAILQMWAAFVSEVAGEKVEYSCFTPEETRLSHEMLTACLISQKEGRAVTLPG